MCLLSIRSIVSSHFYYVSLERQRAKIAVDYIICVRVVNTVMTYTEQSEFIRFQTNVGLHAMQQQLE
jgi:hypothetical protein